MDFCQSIRSRVSCRARCFISVESGQDRWIKAALCAFKAILVELIQHDSMIARDARFLTRSEGRRGVL